jgi:hypothetical protein
VRFPSTMSTSELEEASSKSLPDPYIPVPATLTPLSPYAQTGILSPK